MRLWELFRLALGGVRRTPLRVILTALGVAIATGALVSMVGFALGIQTRAEEPFQRLELLNRIDVLPSAAAAAALDDEAVARIAALPGVVVAYPELSLERAEIVHGAHVQKTSATGLPREAGRLRFLQQEIVAGRFFTAGAEPEVILGSRLAKDLGFTTPAEAVGQTLTFRAKGLVPAAGQTFTLSERAVPVTVVGVWNPPGGRLGYTADGLVLPLDLICTMPGLHAESALERLLHSRTRATAGYERVVVRVERPRDLFEVEGRIQEDGWKTETFLGRIKEMRTFFVLIDLVLTAVGGVALTVAGLGIVNTQLMAVLERYREIGTYKALGASDGDVRWLFLAEAVLVGFSGGLGGLALGRVVSWVIEIVVNALARRHGIDEPIVAFEFPLGLLLGTVGFAVVISMLGGVYPASRAARVDPVRALRGE
jgi:putative ABC transport system permease protein